MPSGLTLSARDRSQRIEPAGDGAEKALFGLHVGREGAKQRRLRPVRPLGAAEPLDRGIGLPTGLEQIMTRRRRFRADSSA